MSSPLVVDVSAENFQAVVEQSVTTPVLLDFWADWCGPCKTLGPVLEKLAAEYGGAFVLGKVDTQKEPELSQAFGVQGIPFCVLVQGGRPVDAFTGALPEAEVRAFLEKAGVEPAAGESESAPEAEDPDSPAAHVKRGLQAAAAGDPAAARAAVEGFPEEDDQFVQVEHLRDGLVFLESPLQEDGPGAEGMLARARQLFLAGQYEPAMGQVLEAVATDREFRDGLGRRAMLLCFLVVGEEDPRCDDYRRRLATLLY